MKRYFYYFAENIFLSILIVLIFATLFYISPVIFLFLILILMFLMPSNVVYRHGYLLIIFGSFQLSLINSIREPSSDLLTYIERYNLYGNMDWASFLLQIKTDFIFYYIGKLLYTITNHNEQAFIFFWSFIIYFLISLSVLMFYRNDRVSKDAFILGMIVLFFSTTFLSLSSHLIRQMVAGSIFIYYLTSLYFGKNKKLLLLVMFGIHFSSLVLLFYPFLKNKKILISAILLTVFMIVTNTNIFNLLVNYIPVIDSSYLGFINSQINGAINKVKDDGNVPYSVYIVSLTLILYLAYQIEYKKINKLKIIIIPFLYCFLLFNLFAPIQLLWLRYSFYQYPFYFIIFPMLFTSISNTFNYTKFGFWIISLLYFLMFFVYFDNNIWSNETKIVNIIEQSIFYFLRD